MLPALWATLLFLSFSLAASVPSRHLSWGHKARFGLLIHWEPISPLGKEISWFRRGLGVTETIPVELYENRYRNFNPTKFSAPGWAKLAKDTGAGYMVFAATHHDGFCMSDSGADGLQSHPLTLRPGHCRSVCRGVPPRGPASGLLLFTARLAPPGLPQKKHSRYIQYFHGQIKELLTKYGRADLFGSTARVAGRETRRPAN